LNYSSLSGSITVGDVLTVGTSGAQATVESISSGTILAVFNNNLDFLPGETISTSTPASFTVTEILDYSTNNTFLEGEQIEEFELVSSVNNTDLGILHKNASTVFNQLFNLQNFTKYEEIIKVMISEAKTNIKLIQNDMKNIELMTESKINDLDGKINNPTPITTQNTDATTSPAKKPKRPPSW
jgi:hypothetical protein